MGCNLLVNLGVFTNFLGHPSRPPTILHVWGGPPVIPVASVSVGFNGCVGFGFQPMNAPHESLETKTGGKKLTAPSEYSGNLKIGRTTGMSCWYSGSMD